MGDIIDSQSKKDKPKLIDAFKKQVNKVNGELRSFIASPLTVTLGDEFQGVMTNPKAICEAIFIFEESLLLAPVKYSLRYSANYGPIETTLNHKEAHGMYGDGLTRARSMLESLKTQKTRFNINMAEGPVTEHLRLLFDLYQTSRDKWPIKQHPVIDHYLKTKDYNSLYEAGYYKTKAGAWKIIQSLELNDYLKIKQLILQSLLWLS